MSDGKMSPEPGSPRTHDVVFVYAWDPESRRTAETLCSGDHFDVTVRVVDGTPPDSSEVGAQRLVACVLFVSPVALPDPSFAAVVSQCSGSRLLHSDFRLFAWLTGGLTFDELRDEANQGPPGNPCLQLLESVHLQRSAAAVTANGVADLLDQYLSALTDLRSWEVAKSIKQTMAGVALGGVGLSILNGALAAAAAWWYGPELVGGPTMYWVLFGMGQVTFYAALSLISIRSPKRMGWLDSGIRLCLIASAASLFRVIPLDTTAAHWPFVAAGFLASAIGDVSLRGLFDARRWRHFAEPAANGGDGMDRVTPPAISNWRLFFFGPLIPPPPRVFISYSESSKWASQMASELWHELHNYGVPSFFAPRCIAEGSGWRHRLRAEISNCSLLVLLQDQETMDSKWTQAELCTAATQQAYSGLPTVVVFRRPGTDISRISTGKRSSCISATLSPAPDSLPGLNIVDYSPALERKIVSGLADRWHGPERALLSNSMGRLLDFMAAIPRRLLVGLGRHSGFAAWAILLSEAVILPGLLRQRYAPSGHVLIVLTLVTAYLCGWGLSSEVGLRSRYRYKLIIRTARYLKLPFVAQSVRDISSGDSEGSLRRLHWRLSILIITEAPLLMLANPLVRVYAGLVCAFGLLLGLTDDETADWRSGVPLE